jgi:hypothetical protein
MLLHWLVLSFFLAVVTVGGAVPVIAMSAAKLFCSCCHYCSYCCCHCTGCFEAVLWLFSLLQMLLMSLHNLLFNCFVPVVNVEAAVTVTAPAAVRLFCGCCQH